MQIQVTMWGANATKLPFAEGAVLAIKGAQVSEYGGKSLNVGDSSQIFLNIEHPRTHKLQAWYQANPLQHKLAGSLTAQMESKDGP